MTRIQQAIAVAASAERMSAACLKVPARRDDEHYCRSRISRSFDLVDAKLCAYFRRLVKGTLPWPLYLHGNVGSGKTRAALALCDKLEFARFWTLEDVIQSMLARDAPWQTVWGRRPRLVVLDEIGKRLKETDLEYNALYLFSEWREDLPAIYISNHPPKRLTELYDERMESRLSCGTVFPLMGPDRRIRR